jgi:tetratricopeptide (TPR) repeat protein
MYYRYKSRRRNKRIYKFIFIILFAASAVFAFYRYGNYLMFWKYSFSKMEKKIVEAESTGDREARRRMLSELDKAAQGQKYEGLPSSEVFLNAGKLHLLIGETYLTGSFSDIIINDSIQNIPLEARNEFELCIKNINKGLVLSGAADVNEYLMMLAKACYYIKYSTTREIYDAVARIDRPETLKSLDDIRFYALISILNGKEDYGFELLKGHGRVSESVSGIVFLATVSMMAKKYTSSIMEYKQALEKTTDSKVLKLVHINLGKIFFTQSLFRESLEHFNNALKIDEKDIVPKIWIGKNYQAMGDKSKAQAIWSEVMASDNANEEAKKLLGIM